MKISPILKRAKNVIDAISIRLFIAIVALTVPFVILQPIIWRAAFDEQPSSTATDIGNVLSLLVTLLTFALAAYGLITYRFIKNRLEQDLTERLSNKINEELKPGFIKMHALSARNALEQSLKEWRRYEMDLWYEKHHYDPKFQQEDAFKRRVDMAIQYGEDALEHARQLSEEEGYELLRLRYDAVNNLAYHLGTRRAGEDHLRARELCTELFQLIPNITQQELGEIVPPDPLHWEEDVADLALWLNQAALETIVWVSFRFETQTQPDGTIIYPEVALNILIMLFTKGVFEPEDQKKYQEKYDHLFSIRFEEDRAIDEQKSGGGNNAEHL